MKPALALALVLATTAGAPAATTRVLLLDAGDQAILAVHVRPAAGGPWSADLLGFARVIDVGQGRTLAIPVQPHACFYDVRATYQDGAKQTRKNLDLCRVHHVTFEP